MMNQLLMSVLSQRKSVLPEQVTNLTGYTWVGNDNLNLEQTTQIEYNINFINQTDTYTQFILARYDTEMFFANELWYDNNSNRAYSGWMFGGWQNNDYKTVLFTGGTDVTNTELISWLQENGTLTPPEPVTNYVRFVSVEARTITPKYTNSGVTLQYSVDSGATWTTISSGSETTSATEHWFRGQATGTKSLFTSSDVTNAWAFSGSSDLEVYGNLNFLLCDTLGDEVAPTSLASNCYGHMFRGCTSLTTAPELPATTLNLSCYRNMFRDCTSLTTAPELPATILAEYCYGFMFRDCTLLTTAPELPATSLASSCYRGMFNGCTLLTTAPELPATTLEDYCYYQMFQNCTSFKVSSIKEGAYQYDWRIPTSGIGTTASNWSTSMLSLTGGTFTGIPTINTIYYVENQPV